MKRKRKLAAMVLAAAAAVLLGVTAPRDAAAGALAGMSVLAPNGGEQLMAGQMVTVRWTAAAAAHHYGVYLATGATTSWRQVAGNLSGTSYRWRAPVSAANVRSAWIRVVGFSAAGAVVASDRSDAPFSIDVVDVRRPASNAQLVGGTAATVSWRLGKTVRPVARVRVLLSRNGGTTYAQIASLNAPGGVAPLSFAWPVPIYALSYDACRIKVELRDGAGLAIGADTSPGSFAIAPPGAMVSSWGTMKVGSLKLNGVTYTAAAGATRRRDDTGVTEAELRDGMEVKLRGRRNDDGLTGVYLQVEAEDELQGRVSGLDTSAAPPRFTVLSQLIYTDDLTIFANFPPPGDVTALAAAQFVEVHGQRDLAGAVRATRVELLAGTGDPDPEHPELKGRIGSLTPTTFTIGTQAVNYSGAQIVPAGATLADGNPVEVEGPLAGAVLMALRVEREDLEDEPFEPREGQKAEVEGYLQSLVDNGNGTFAFVVAGTAVGTTAATAFVGGSPLDLAEGVKVEAEGYLTGGTLVAYRVEFRRARVRLEAEATAASAGGLTLVGVAVALDDLTKKDPADLVPAVGTRYEVRGYQDSAGSVLAEEIRERGGGGAEIIQGPVSAFDATAGSVTILGITGDLGGAGVVFKSTAEQVITREQFFAALKVGTVVKVKGMYASGTIAGEEAELEN